MRRPRQRSRVALLVWGCVFTLLALVVPLFGAWPLLIHAHGEVGHHVHALPQASEVALEERHAWHAHQHAGPRSGGHGHEHEHGDGDGDETGPGADEFGPVPEGLVLQAPAPWIRVASSPLGHLLELGAAVRTRSPRVRSEEDQCGRALRPRSEWPPPGGSSSGVRGLLQQSHALLI